MDFEEKVALELQQRAEADKKKAELRAPILAQLRQEMDMEMPIEQEREVIAPAPMRERQPVIRGRKPQLDVANHPISQSIRNRRNQRDVCDNRNAHSAMEDAIRFYNNMIYRKYANNREKAKFFLKSREVPEGAVEEYVKARREKQTQGALF